MHRGPTRRSVHRTTHPLRVHSAPTRPGVSRGFTTLANLFHAHTAPSCTRPNIVFACHQVVHYPTFVSRGPVCRGGLRLLPTCSMHTRRQLAHDAVTCFSRVHGAKLYTTQYLFCVLPSCTLPNICYSRAHGAKLHTIRQLNAARCVAVFYDPRQLVPCTHGAKLYTTQYLFSRAT